MDDLMRSTGSGGAATIADPLAGRIIDALGRRHFDDLRACLEPDVRMRAVLPRAVIEVCSADEAVDRFAGWFGGDDELELLEAATTMIGARRYLRWRIRMWPTEDPRAARTVEQHVFTRGLDRVESLDLLCSGFQADVAGGLR